MNGFGGIVTAVVKGGWSPRADFSNGANSFRWPKAWAALKV